MIILGIDFGLKKIGLALAVEGFVSPLKTVEIQDVETWWLSEDFEEKEKVDLIVVGLPEGESGVRAKNFGIELEKVSGIKVRFSDETLSTQEANRIMGQANRPASYKKEMEDAIAAAVMLESYVISNRV